MVKIFRKHPIFCTILVSIMIGLVCLILYTNNYYERELLEPPKLYIVNEDGLEKEFILTSYIWNYKNNVNNFQSEFDENNYDFSETNTIIIPNTSYFFLKTNPKHKLKKLHLYWSKLENGEFKELYDIPYESFDEKYAIEFYNKTGIYLFKVKAKDCFNNTVEYVIRIVAINGDDILAIQSLLNTKISETEKVNTVVNHLIMSNYLEAIKQEGSNLKLTYKYYPGDDSLDGMSAILFTCIDDLENIEFSFSHSKYIKNEIIEDEENYETKQVEFDLMEPVLKSRNEVLQKKQEESKIIKGEY